MTAPFSLLAEAVRQHGSPLWAYDASTIAERVEQLKVFDTVRFAQKANPNLHVLRLMRAHGLVLDAVSLGEMERAFAAGARVDGDPAGVVLTCDALDRPTLERVVASKIEVNVEPMIAWSEALTVWPWPISSRGSWMAGWTRRRPSRR